MAIEAPVGARLVLPDRLTARAGRRRTWLLATAGALAAAAGIVWLTRAPAPSVGYRTEPAQRRTIVRLVEAVGHLDVPRRTLVTPSTAGRLDQIDVVVGQSVRAGEVLARLDRSASALAVESARAALVASRQRVTEAHASWTGLADARTRAERLAGHGLASAGDVVVAQGGETRARAVLRAAQSEREIAAHALEAAALQDRLATITAPIDGVVLDVPPAPGGAVGPTGGPLFVLGDTLIRLTLEVPVAEADIAEVQPGQAASFTVPAFPGRTFVAHVERRDLEPRRDRSAVTYLVTLAADNPGQSLLPGMTAAVQIEVGRAADVLAVREAALRFVPAGVTVDRLRAAVWRLEGRTIRPVLVEPGLSDGAYTEVRPRDGARLVPGQALVIGLSVVTDPGVTGPGVTLGRRR